MLDSGLVELQEAIPAGSTIRLTFDAQTVGQTEGYLFGVDNVLFRIVAPGDTDGNGEVDSDDLFNMLGAAKFNAGPYTITTLPAALATVPEPSTFILAAIALIGLLAYTKCCRWMMWIWVYWGGSPPSGASA